MDHMINPKLEILNRRIDESKDQLNEKLLNQEKTILSAVTKIKAEVSETLNSHINEFKESKTDFSAKYERLKLDLREYQDRQDQQNNERETLVYGSIKSLSDKIARMHFDIIDNHDNIAVTYVNPDGKIEYGAIKKVLPDNDTIKMNQDNKLYLNYNFNKKCFTIDSNNNIAVDGLILSDGNCLSAAKIKADLNNTKHNLDTVNHKLDKILTKIDSSNGYIASNDFKNSLPQQDDLTNFAISCLSIQQDKISESDIPANTKIKNLFDNHIWVLNKVKTIDGLTRNKWEDFGSDTICIANNAGIHGLITGSQDKFKGYIDVKGTLSINGLEEELNKLTQVLMTLNTDLNQYKLIIENRLSEIEQQLANLK